MGFRRPAPEGMGRRPCEHAYSARGRGSGPDSFVKESTVSIGRFPVRTRLLLHSLCAVCGNLIAVLVGSVSAKGLWASYLRCGTRLEYEYPDNASAAA